MGPLDNPLYTLPPWIVLKVEPMPTKLKGQSLATRSGVSSGGKGFTVLGCNLASILKFYQMVSMKN
jgi:hypothetical protein